MKNSLWLITILLTTASLEFGCHSNTGFGSPEISIAEPVRPRHISAQTDLHRFYFGGLYNILKVDRFEGARNMAAGSVSTDMVYEDGAVGLRIEPVPFGMQLEIANKLQRALTVDGLHSAMIDSYGSSHKVELRYPSNLSLSKEPCDQTIVVAPQSVLTIDFDVIAPEFRERIIEDARSAEERGAFIVTTAPFPVFCSGYYLYPGHEPETENVRTWSFFRKFGLYISLHAGDESFGYTAWVTPFRFGIGSVQNPEWQSTQPSSIDDAFRGRD